MSPVEHRPERIRTGASTAGRARIVALKALRGSSDRCSLRDCSWSRLPYRVCCSHGFLSAPTGSPCSAVRRKRRLCLFSKNASRRLSTATYSGGGFFGANVNANICTGFPSSAAKLTPRDERATVNAIRCTAGCFRWGSANPRPKTELPRRSRAITCRVISAAAASSRQSGADMAETISAMTASSRSLRTSAIKTSATKKSHNRIWMLTFRSESALGAGGVRRG